MGRQAHVTRLALGRSPFEEPLRDEAGNFVLGPGAHSNDASGYEQQFDDRGHPQNRSSKAAARRLRRSQNDVLETVGVAVRKGEERKTRWEKLEEGERRALLCEENDLGRLLQAENQWSTLVLSWCVVSLRKRLMTFTYYSSLPLMTIVSKEIRLLGLHRWLFPGLTYYTLSQLLQVWLRNPNLEAVVSFTDPWDDRQLRHRSSTAGTWYLTTMVMRCLELPVLVHVTLQALQIIPATAGLTWKLWIPFAATSPISLPSLPHTVRFDTIIDFAFQLARMPLLLHLCREQLRIQLGHRLFALFRQLLTKPDRPDSLSARVSDENYGIAAGAIAGVGYPLMGGDRDYVKNRRYFGPRSFFGALRMAFPPVYRLLNVFSRGRLARSRGSLSFDLERQLRAAVTQKYWEHRANIEDQPRRESPRDMVYRQWAVEAVFRSANLSPVEELVDPRAWTNDVLGPKADVQRFSVLLQQASNDGWNGLSQPTEPDDERSDLHQYDEAVSNILAEVARAIPVSDVIIIQAVDGQAMILARQSPEGTRNIAEMENIRTIDAGEMPLEAFIRGARGLNQEPEEVPSTSLPLQEFQPQSRTRAASPPPTPTPGITRALSLSDPQVQVATQSNLRPLRRPTETDDSLAAISRTLRAEAEALQSPRPSVLPQSPTRERFEHPLRPPLVDISTVVTPMKHRQYRVTMLSNYAADSLAWHSSAWITSLILWPFETIWLRSIADWALQNPAFAQYIDPWWSARLGFGIIGRPIATLSLNTWFGGAHNTTERLNYAGAILLTLGLEGVIRGACWGLGVWYVKRWKDRYGWGQF